MIDASIVSALCAWVEGVEYLPVDPAVAAFIAADEREITGALRDIKHVLTSARVAAVIAKAHSLLGSEPSVACDIARLATLFVGTFATDEEAENLLALCGDAWKEYAAALLEIGEYREALSATDRARFYYETASIDDEWDLERGENSVLHKLQLLRLVEGSVLYRMDRFDEAADSVERASNILWSVFNNPKGYVQGRTIFASIRLAQHRYRDALDILKNSAEHAREQRDTETLAYILSLVGGCYVRMGETENARSCYNTAVEMFTVLGLTAEIPRVRTGLALGLIQLGRYNEAIAELFEARETFFKLRMSIVAAEVAMKVVDVLFLAKRFNDIEPLCLEMISTFEKAGAPRKVQEALSHISQLASTKRITPGDVERTIKFFQALRLSPEVELPSEIM